MARQDTIRIFIPSYKRARQVTELRELPECKIVIPESQLKDYVEFYPKEQLLSIDDSLDGSHPRKMNALLDLCETGDKIMMIDDDVEYIKRINGNKLTIPEIYGLIEQGFQLIEDLGIHYWGLGWDIQQLHFDKSKPFGFGSSFFSQFVGVIKSDLRFDENIRPSDTDFWLQNTRQDKMTFCFKHYFAKAKVKCKNQTGGIETKEDSSADFNYLYKKWGNKVLKKTNTSIIPVSPYV